MSRTLGLDLGTNSIGWAIVDKDGDSEGNFLIDKGVDIFQEGVKIEKGVESSRAAERTAFRSARKLLRRRKLRKIETIKALSSLEMCPYISEAQLNEWRYKDSYPIDEDFLNWQKTNDKLDKNPYKCRYVAVTETLDLYVKQNRYLLGRAFYHISQRRGFLSNRLESTKESNGAVTQGISELSKEISDARCSYLGEYFYVCYQKGVKIRNKYTSRKEHYEKEFYAICEKQQLPEKTVKTLHKAIFYQRPLRSQKGSVGKCTLEPTKSRCQSSHPRFEEFRMLSFINNIKIKTYNDDSFRPLNTNEKQNIIPLFLRKSAKQFNFEDIAKKIAGKGNYGYYKDSSSEKPYLFNYRMSTSVPGSNVTAQIVNVLGEDWQSYLLDNYKLKGNKTLDEIVNDVWHSLLNFTDEENLVLWAKDNLQLSDSNSTKFAKITLPSEYASLSLCAINKILPYLREGLLYSHSVFLANMVKIIPKHIWSNEESRKSVIGDIASIINNHTKEDEPIEKCIKNHLLDCYGLSYEDSKHLYSPSMIETFNNVLPNNKGIYQLASPRTSSVRNPMAMRTMFRLRALINELLRQGKIDRMTKINIECSRALNDANKRKAIEDYQRQREKKRATYRQEIAELYKKETNKEIIPTDTDVLKYQLWKEEQGEVCIYTGRPIAIHQFIGANPEFDIEHTIAQSVGGEDSQANKTLCESRYNRYVKKAMLPSQLSEHKDILVRIESWKKTYEDLQKQIDKTKGSYSSKEIKDRAIQKRHRLSIERDYYKDKYNRFLMKEVPSGFRRNHDIDNSIIAKYSRLYLKSIFPRIYSIKGYTTAEFRKMWGLQEHYTKKERSNHIHHCVDAITIACIGASDYSEMARYYHNKDNFYNYNGTSRPVSPKPWKTFTEDVLAIEKELFVSHYTPDNMQKPTRKKLRVRGKIQYNKNGEPIYVKGDSARASLHKDTYYGAIKRNDEIKYVVRKFLNKDFKESDINNIVDDVVREKVLSAHRERGFAKLFDNPIWMNEEKGIEIKKVRCYANMVKSPLFIRKQRDLSKHDYKHTINVANDGNYFMSIYEGVNKKGKLERSYEIVNNIDAATYYKAGFNREIADSIISTTCKGLPFRGLIKTGTLVLFYKETPEEIWELNKDVLCKRMYKVVKFAKDGRATFRYHQEARNDDNLKADFEKEHKTKAPSSLTNGESKFDFERIVPKLLLSPGGFNMLIENVDFILTVTGEIKRL